MPNLRTAVELTDQTKPAGRWGGGTAVRGSPSVLAALLLALLLQGCHGGESSWPSFSSWWPSFSADDPVDPEEPAAYGRSDVADAGSASPPGLSRPARAPASVARRLPATARTRTAPTRTAPPARMMTGAAPVTLGRGNFEPQPLTPGAPTGTFVGQRVQQLRADLARLQGNISQYNAELQQLRGRVSQDGQRYRTALAGANSPQQAAAALDELTADVTRMADLADKAAEDAGMASFLLQSVRDAYGLSGAVQEDHRQLAVLEGDTNLTAELFGRMLIELRADVERQSAYLGAERRQLAVAAATTGGRAIYGASRPGPGRPGTGLAGAPAYGGAPVYAGAPTYGAAPVYAGPPAAGAAAPVMMRPLVVIHFDRPNVDYRQTVHAAASQALQRRADAVFDVVAVTPASDSQAVVARNASQARRHAETVLRSLTELGLPSDRITLSATTSPVVRSNEVHIYVR